MKLFILFFMAISFDYKGVEDGGGLIQLFMILLAVISAFLIIIRYPVPKTNHDKYRLFRNILLFLLISTVLTSFLQGVPFERYSRTVIPYLLLVLGYFVGIRAQIRLSQQDIIFMVTISSFSAALFTVIYGVLFSGSGIEKIRYQILSPMLYILIPVLAFKLFVVRKNIIFSASSLTIVFLIILFSATRSWLIAYIGILVLAIALPKAKRWTDLISPLIHGITGISLLSLIIYPLVNFIFPVELERFVGRFLSSDEVGFDITSATRIAEMSYQIEYWLNDSISFLLGNGLGAAYGFAGESASLLYYLFGQEGVDVEWWFAGHNFWVYSFFSQGLLFGWIIPFTLLYSGIASAHGYFKSKNNLSRVEMPSLIVLCILVSGAILLSTIGGNVMGSRALSQFMGIFFAFSIGYYDEMTRQIKNLKKS